MTEDRGEYHQLWNIGLQTLRELETERGILASAKEEIYGCIFGRDTLITSLKLLRVYEKTRHPYFLDVVRKALLSLAELQGREVNIESGEEPGKCIHEFRPDNHAHLTEQADKPWYVYADQSMRNFDSVDATPLFLIATHTFQGVANDPLLVKQMMPHIDAALNWLLEYGDSNDDGLIDYHLSPDRRHGGLITQSWMDSHESVFHEDGSPVTYPIAPIEVQAYSYAALRAWSQFFSLTNPTRAKQLARRADRLKERFQKHFVLHDPTWSLAFAIDGNGKPFTAARSSIGHCLWAARKYGNKLDTILDIRTVPKLVERLLAPDLFEPSAGMRTLSLHSPQFQPNSYHNGSIWPHDTAMVAEGLRNFGYHAEADRVERALLGAYRHFQTPLELFVHHDGLAEYQSPSGQSACKKQAWSTAALLNILA